MRREGVGGSTKEEREERRIEKGIRCYTAVVADMIHSLNAMLLHDILLAATSKKKEVKNRIF